MYICFFQKEYLTLVEQCMKFACEMMDLCRGTQEVEAVLGESHVNQNTGRRDPLARLKLAIRYEEKKVGFVPAKKPVHLRTYNCRCLRPNLSFSISF